MKQKFQIENEKGSVTVLAVVFLMLLTLLGMSALTSSSIETQIAGNELRHKQAFYAAESASAYVVWRPDFYGPDNITPGTPHYFPNLTTSPYVPYTVPQSPQQVNAAGTQSFNGQVDYTGSSSPPRGSGYSIGTFRAHQYQMVSNGYSSNNASENLEIGFYRIGF
jgi:PilX N-terminal